MSCILYSCKKNIITPIVTECKLLLLGDKNTPNTGNKFFYYNHENKLIGRGYFNSGNMPVFSGFPQPRFDTIIYNSNGSVTINSYDAEAPFNQDTMPKHTDKVLNKFDISFENNRISKIMEYSYGTQLVSQKTFFYENDKLMKMVEQGRNASYFTSLQTDYTFNYDGNNVNSIFSMSKDPLGNIVGGDTTRYTYTNLKNPYKSVNLFFDYYFHSLSENVWISYDYRYNYNFGSSGTTNINRGYSDNGNIYPNEIGILKCN